MKFTILDWNIGGAKFLEEKEAADRLTTRTMLNDALIKLIDKTNPDVVTLQEIVKYKQPKDSTAKLSRP